MDPIAVFGHIVKCNQLILGVEFVNDLSGNRVKAHDPPWISQYINGPVKMIN
jgi:hypothetical protein